MTDKIYEFAYTDCIYESAMAAISLHKTEKGAETAMYLHKEEKRKEWIEMFGMEDEQIKTNMEFGKNSAWGVYERELLE